MSCRQRWGKYILLDTPTFSRDGTVPFRVLYLRASDRTGHVSGCTLQVMDVLSFFSLTLWLSTLLTLGLLLLAFLRSDCDLTLAFHEKFGKKPSRVLMGKVVWITGASSGIGEELAYALAACGARLVLSARRERELRQVLEKCKGRYLSLITSGHPI